MNFIATQPLKAKPVDPSISADPALIAPAAADAELGETIKQRVRRLAAHCNRYRGSDPQKAVVQLLSTVLPLLGLIVAMFVTVKISYWLTLLLAIPAGGLVVRAFIIQHDCGHGSFFSSRRLNDFTGRCMSVLTLTPYGLWRREHAQHHATSGNLDKRGAGDIDTLTVKEYLALSTFGKIRYRIYRSPLFLFGIGVPAYFLIIQRLPWVHALSARDSWRSVIGLNLALVAVYGPLIYFFGASDVLLIVVPMIHLASAAGGWLFFIQHQFEETVWEKTEGWDFQVAALLGSSFYDLPKILNWFTGNIGLHHIHHLNSMIPNYKLQDCLNASPDLKSINRLTLMDSFKCASLKLWDEDQQKLVGFGDIRTA